MTTLPVFVYEGFSYTIAKPFDLSSITVSNSTGLPATYFTSNLSTGVTFATTAASNILTGGTTEAFDITFSGSAGTVISSNIVPIGAGRFTDLSGNSVNNNAYTFFNKEPIPPIRLKAPFTIGLTTSVPTLPPGLAFFRSDSNVDISGTPLTTVPTSNYLLIGKSSVGSKIVTTNLTISISNERILYNLSGSPIISGMTIGNAITPRVLTAAFPPYPSGGTIRYSWPTLPDGIQILDVSGNVIPTLPFGYVSTDPSHILTIAGTPTLQAANDFKNSDISSSTISIQGVRTNPLPAITSNIALTFSFAETVLFDQSTIPILYTNVPLVTGADFFRAQTYFETGPGTVISNIFSPDLRSDLSLNFNPLTSQAVLTGTPTSPGSAIFTIRATNSNNVTRDYLTPITVQDDVVTFVSPTPAQDTSYNFIFSRPVDLAKTGYYPSNIQFVATAASGLPVVLSAPALSGTGLSLSPTGVITGLPTTVTGITDLFVNATVTGTPATASRRVRFEILNDEFSFATPPSGSFNFVQNRPITPFQISVTTLSDRNITGYASTGFPSGVSISPAGVISGTPLTIDGSSVSIVATTGFASGSNPFSYTVEPDTLLFRVPEFYYDLSLGGPVPPIPITGLSYSGVNVSNFLFSNLPITYGMTIDSNTGIFGGTFTTSIPPQDILVPTVDFNVTGQAGSLVSPFPVTLSTVNAPTYKWYLGYLNTIQRTDLSFNEPWSTIATLDSQFEYDPNYTDITVRPVSLTSNVIIGVTGTYQISRSLDGINFENIDVYGGIPPPDPPVIGGPLGPLKITHVPNTSIVYAVGSASPSETYQGIFFSSQDDGATWTYNRPLIGSWYNGNAVAYKDGVVLIGGGDGEVSGEPNIYRSLDGGVTWSGGDSSPERWVSEFSVRGSRWVVAGSDLYTEQTGGVGPCTTLWYSDTQGSNWFDATGGPEVIATHVDYGSGTWIAGGYDAIEQTGSILPYIKVVYSSDGATWSTINLPDISTSMDPEEYQPTFIVGVNFDGDQWQVLVSIRDDSPVGYVRVYSHSATGDFTTGWSYVTLDTAIDDRLVSFVGKFLTSDGPVGSALVFPPIGDGPTVTSPTQLSYLFYQYIPITSIQLTATGNGIVYFFVQTDQLPPGLTFNPSTNQITGTPAQIGKTTTTIYAKDDIGVTLIQITFTVIIPRIIRKQDGAGAYTSLLRQYTEVLGAQGGRDNRALPSEERALGEFMSPEGPNVITQVIDPKCRNPNC